MTGKHRKYLLSLLALFVCAIAIDAQTVTKTFQNEALPTALKDIGNQTGYSFIYEPADLENAPRVTVSFDKEPLVSALAKILRPPLKYEVKGTIVIISKEQVKPQAGAPGSKEAKKPRVEGSVTDMRGEPVIGAAVWIKGTRAATTTDLEGRFSLIRQAGNNTLCVSALSFQPWELTLPEGNQSLNIVLRDEANTLEEVVVVGMNNRQTRRAITGAISTIQTRELVQSPVANISNALAGKLPGLFTVQYSGEPGADASSLYIRGLGTYGTSAPLVVIDGLPRNKADFDMLDANEIESITILKDASSSSLYGIQGANGVVVVTTRRGSGDERPKISFTIQQALQQPIRLPQTMSSYEQAMYNRAVDYNDGQPLRYTEEVLEIIKNGSDPYLYPNVNWFDVVLKDHSWQSQYNINISGSAGREHKVNYFVSGSYIRQGTLLNHEDEFEANYGVSSKYDRYNFRSNIDFQATKRLNVRIDLAGRLETRIGPSYSFPYVFGQITSRLPSTQAIFNPNGTLAAGSALEIPYQPGNPYGIITRSGYYNKRSNVMNGTISARHALDFITDGLSVQAYFSFENTSDLNRSWSQTFESYWYRGKDEYGNDYYQDYTSNGRLTAGTSSYVERYVYLDLRLNYDKEFGRHQLNAQILGNRTVKDIQSSEYSYAYQGISGRATWNYARRYFLEGNIGFNGSENFPPGRRYGLFPAISGGWLINEEPWLNAPSWIKIFKLRGSYGVVGNDQIGGSRFLFITEFGPGGGLGSIFPYGYYFGTTNGGTLSAGGYNQTRFGNAYVTWEKSHKANVGFDLSLFKDNSVNFTFDYFREMRDNILTEAGSVPDYVGIETVAPRNSGKVFNHGIEAELRLSKRISKDLSIFTNIQGTWAKNKVLENDQPSPKFDYQDLRGYEIGYSLGYHAIGLFENQEDIDSSPTQSFGPVIPGDIKYEDVNKDGVIDPDDRIPLRVSSIPIFTGGLSMGFNWKNFDFSMMLSGALGGTARFFVYPSSIINLQRWTEDNHDALLPVAHTTANNTELSDQNLLKTDYLKLRNIELGYTIPIKVLQKVRISSARVYLNAQNVAVWDKLWVKDRDPEAAGSGTLPYPLQRIVNMGLRFDL